MRIMTTYTSVCIYKHDPVSSEDKYYPVLFGRNRPYLQKPLFASL